ncbi:copper resistance CopC/CopD family protein [Streptomyces sp. NPDC002104]
MAGLCLVVGGASQADAHAVLTSSTPARGAVTAEPPSRVTLVFTEEIAVTPDAVRVLDPAGRRVDDVHPVAEGGNTYSVALRGELPRGTYTVAYQGVSADSHPIAGAFTFSVGAPSTTAVSPGVGTRDPDAGFVGRAYAAGRLGAYIGVILLVGAACLLLWCWPEGRESRLLRGAVMAGWGMTVLSTLALLVLRSAYTGSGRLAEVADIVQLGNALRTKTGALLGVRLALLAGCAVLWARRGASWPPARSSGVLLGWAALTAAGLAGTWAGAEHASAGLQPLVAMPVDAAHLLAAGTWVGGLFVLALLLLRRQEVSFDALARFSQAAFVSVCTLVVTGLYQAWRQVGSPSGLVETRFGLLLLAKAAGVGLLLCLGYLSRRWTRRLARATPESPVPSLRRLRRGVAVEAALGLCVIVVTAALTSTEPARSEASAAAAGGGRAQGPVAVEVAFDTGGPKGAGTADVIVDPGLAGPNGVHVTLTDRNGEPVDAPSVEASLTSPSTKIGPLPVPLRLVSEGHWSASDFQVPMPGDWELALTVRTSDIDQITVRRTVRLR